MTENEDVLTIINEESKEIVLTENANTNNKIAIPESEFIRELEKGKINILRDKAANDNEFIDKLQEEIKQAAIKSAELEQDVQEFKQQNLKYESELLSTKQKLNIFTQTENKWENRKRRREFHFNGTKPIMDFLRIKEPLNLFILYFLVVIIMPFYLLSKLLNATIGNLITGVESKERAKSVKGFMWTLLGFISLIIVSVLVFLTLKYIIKVF